ncbi:acyl-CoA dehydrogenase family protein, partial [Aquidulcibacter sp.]|uniref:acyl-CoA dehydrogenase family protein n=1 Tax=Aquidulcibacter sp. TaxID=2052990 RepID=UPI0025BB1C5B
MSGFEMSEEHRAIEEAVGRICAKYDDAFWSETDETGRFPEPFVADMADGGWLGCAFPEAYGGAGLGLVEAALVMKTVAQSGAGFSGASAIHLNIFGPKPI